MTTTPIVVNVVSEMANPRTSIWVGVVSVDSTNPYALISVAELPGPRIKRSHGRGEGLRRVSSQFEAMSQTAATDPITLYRLQACPYCERVVRRLQELDVEYESRFIEPLHSERTVVKRVSGKRTVPAIEDPNTGVTMSESANIVEYLDGTYGEGAA